MGYGYYSIPTPDGQPMERGYAVLDICSMADPNAEGTLVICGEAIDRGMGYLCYCCTFYFCGAHLTFADEEQECFAGASRQVCAKCSLRLNSNG